MKFIKTVLDNGAGDQRPKMETLLAHPLKAMQTNLTAYRMQKPMGIVTVHEIFVNIVEGDILSLPLSKKTMPNFNFSMTEHWLDDINLNT